MPSKIIYLYSKDIPTDFKAPQQLPRKTYGKFNKTIIF